MEGNKFEQKPDEPKEILVAVSELRGDNVLDEETIKGADLIEVKFFDREYSGIILNPTILC